MKYSITILLLAILATLTGCLSTSPIKTTIDYSTAPATGMPALSYSSEKDISYERTVTDPETGIVEMVKFSANASDPATVQARAQENMLKYAVELGAALGGNAERILTPLPIP